MSFYENKTKDIIVDHEDQYFVYFRRPERIKVDKIDHCIYRKKVSNDTWVKAKTFLNYKGGYPCISVNCELWSAPRIIATALVPNPNNYKYVHNKDGNRNNVEPTNLEWKEFLSDKAESNEVTTKESREENLADLVPHSKEYHDAYNKLKGKDGLTHSERYHKFYRDLGMVICPKKYSPTGRGFYCDPLLRLEIKIATENGSIKNPEVLNILMEKIAAQPRKNKIYKNSSKKSN